MFPAPPCRRTVALLCAAILLAGGLSACTKPARLNPARSVWTTGFWFWGGSSDAVAASADALDVLFVQVGTIHRGPRGEWPAYGRLPDRLPTAREYWLVFRVNEPVVPTAAPGLPDRVDELLIEARRRKLSVAGIQLDIDAPTRLLGDYATFLRDVRTKLPAGVKVSITALLDWFRGGTAIASVIREVDEFVPQFYDAPAPGSYGDLRDLTIAARIDPATWGPVFNRFGKPFRVGISSFGRARYVPPEGGSGGSWRTAMTLRDATPLDFAIDPAFTLTASRTPSQEVTLRYSATRRTGFQWIDFERGAQVEFILPTTESMRTAVLAAKSMGGHCIGVLFFRWPAFQESLAAQPDQVLRAAGVLTAPLTQPTQLRTVDKACAAVRCTDLYLLSAEPLSPEPARIVVRSSAPLEYFVPADRLPVRMSSPRTLELLLPPYSGRSRLYLGRAVTNDDSAFTLGTQP